AAGAGEDEGGLMRQRDRFELLGIEAVQECRLHGRFGCAGKRAAGGGSDYTGPPHGAGATGGPRAVSRPRLLAAPAASDHSAEKRRARATIASWRKVRSSCTR